MDELRMNEITGIYNEKKLYKEIRYAITLAVKRFYREQVFDTKEEDVKWIKKTARSVFNEYKRDRQYYELIRNKSDKLTCGN
jgi:cytochrome b subunit of formate dehydrogenase